MAGVQPESILCAAIGRKRSQSSVRRCQSVGYCPAQSGADAVASFVIGFQADESEAIQHGRPCNPSIETRELSRTPAKMDS